MRLPKLFKNSLEGTWCQNNSPTLPSYPSPNKNYLQNGKCLNQSVSLHPLVRSLAKTFWLRLHQTLLNFISPNQSYFIKEKNISENVFLSITLLKVLNIKCRGHNTTIKLFTLEVGCTWPHNYLWITSIFWWS